MHDHKTNASIYGEQKLIATLVLLHVCIFLIPKQKVYFKIVQR